MSGQFIGASSLSIPDRRVLMRPALPKDKVAVQSASTNVDASGPRTTMLRPGNILVKGASDGKWYDDVSGGQASAPAYVLSAEAPDGDWDTGSVTVTLTIDGVAIVTITLSGSALDVATVVSELNAVEEFRAHAIASDNGSDDLVRITATNPAAHIKVTSSLSTAFGASGQAAFPTEADIVVTTEYCDQLDPFGTAKDARADAVRAGDFDEDKLIFAGAAATAHAQWPDFKRILAKRGSRFE